MSDPVKAPHPKTPRSVHDPVELIVVLSSGGVIRAGCMARHEASANIRLWWQHRQQALTRLDPRITDEEAIAKDRELTEHSYRWLTTGSVALNAATRDGVREDGTDTYAMSAWSVSQVAGMYVMETDTGEAQRLRYLKSLADLAEQERKRRQAGDEWKEGASDADSGDQ